MDILIDIEVSNESLTSLLTGSPSVDDMCHIKAKLQGVSDLSYECSFVALRWLAYFVATRMSYKQVTDAGAVAMADAFKTSAFLHWLKYVFAMLSNETEITAPAL